MHRCAAAAAHRETVTISNQAASRHESRPSWGMRRRWDGGRVPVGRRRVGQSGRSCRPLEPLRRSRSGKKRAPFRSSGGPPGDGHHQQPSRIATRITAVVEGCGAGGMGAVFRWADAAERPVRARRWWWHPAWCGLVGDGPLWPTLRRPTGRRSPSATKPHRGTNCGRRGGDAVPVGWGPCSGGPTLRNGRFGLGGGGGIRRGADSLVMVRSDPPYLSNLVFCYPGTDS